MTAFADRGDTAPGVECSFDSHERAKLRNSGSLSYLGPQLNDEGEIDLILVNCCRCGSTLGVTAEQWLASVGPRLQLVRRPDTDGAR